MSLTDFKNNFSGGTRKNRFYISGSFPGGSFTKVHVTSTSMPSVVSISTEYNHFGRVWRYPGEKDYTHNWSFTVLDDYQQGNNTVNLWRQFQSWQNLINDHETNKSKMITATGTYKQDNITIYQLGINGEESGKPIKKFILNGCWPVKINPIKFRMSNASALNEFIVTLQWDSIEIGGVTAPFAGGDSTTPLDFS